MYFQNKAANAVHYPRAADPILGYDSRKTTTKSLADSAALRGIAGKNERRSIFGFSRKLSIQYTL